MKRYEAKRNEITLKQFAHDEGLNYWTFIEHLYAIRKGRNRTKYESPVSESLRMIPVEAASCLSVCLSAVPSTAQASGHLPTAPAGQAGAEAGKSVTGTLGGESSAVHSASEMAGG